MDMQHTVIAKSFIEELYEKYKVSLLRAIRRQVGDAHVYEDIFHGVMIQIISKAEILKSLPTEKMEAYIFLIAHGLSCDYLRKKYRHAEISIDEDVLASIISSDGLNAGPMNAFEKIELSIIMDGIPKEERLLLIGKYYLSLNTKELSALVGISPVAVRSRIHRTKKKAFEQLRKAGLNLEDFMNE